MSEKREYEDYEELGRNIREAYQSLHDIDLHKANETLRAAVAKAASMWDDEDPQMLVAVSRLRSLQHLEPQPYIERPELRSPEDTASTARKRLNDLRYAFHKAFLTDVGRHQAFLAKVKVLRIPIAYIYSRFSRRRKTRRCSYVALQRTQAGAVRLRLFSCLYVSEKERCQKFGFREEFFSAAR